jgi:hypothetical protein
MGERPEYRPFRDLRSVPESGRPISLWGQGGWGRWGWGGFWEQCPTLVKTCFHFWKVATHCFGRNRCKRRQKIVVELLPTRTSPSLLENVWKNNQSEQPRTYLFVSRYNIFYRLPRQNHRLQQQQLVIVGLSPDSPLPLDHPTDHTKYRVKETAQEGAGRTGVFFFGVGGSMLWCSQSGDDPQENLARFGYKLNMKVNFKEIPSIFLANYWNHE